MANLEEYAQIDLAIAEQYYSIRICRNALANPQELHYLVSGKQALIITNETVAPLYLSYLQEAFAHIQLDVVVLADGEMYKNQQSLLMIYDTLVHNHHHRDTTIIALGGGVVGDVAGFAAATYHRGVAYVQIPTTLLAQVDASVGGKTAINHPMGKNLIGSFYQPKAVLIDVNTLSTLKEREFRAGLAEVIKYALLAGGTFFDALYAALAAGIRAESAELPQLIATCCRIKAKYVALDEKEIGVRAHLNLGHTFAHALEAYSGYEQWLHGEAVAIGLYCAGLLSHKMGLLSQQVVEQIEQMMHYAGLPHKIPSNFDLLRLKGFMELDKKIKNNALRFVVMREPGDCYLESKITEDCLYNTLVAAVEGE